MEVSVLINHPKMNKKKTPWYLDPRMQTLMLLGGLELCSCGRAFYDNTRFMKCKYCNKDGFEKRIKWYMEV